MYLWFYYPSFKLTFRRRKDEDFDSCLMLSPLKCRRKRPVTRRPFWLITCIVNIPYSLIGCDVYNVAHDWSVVLHLLIVSEKDRPFIIVDGH